jgi:hypothetical protein
VFQLQAYFELKAFAFDEKANAAKSAHEESAVMHYLKYLNPESVKVPVEAKPATYIAGRWHRL